MKLNPWPLSITVLCVAAFAAAATVVMVMVRQSVELVAPDYYARDLRHQERIDQELRARSLEHPAAIFYDGDAQSIVVELSNDEAEGTITLYRPSDLSLDRSIPIVLDENGRQIIPATELASGLWRVSVEWTMNGESYFREEALRLP